MDVKTQALIRALPYAIQALKTPGHFLSSSNDSDGVMNGIAIHDARIARDWLLGLIEPNRPNYDASMDWRRP